ncbi:MULTISPECIES: signal recognition particle-docking protein FtsY [Devosia]|uniref:Signal recognition particle receptor FtsY n=1 Tax=Devosia equisanguinis TaxID=2490941 RepID=A0A3S4DNB0_9HYPH|nr:MULTISPECIES: signal recognition particle-docking protein FtsY [Devosia]ODT51246.1 MAG: signal recognition particle-docking protein FtsY [Pelagibacterium sp. SCN 63-126]ODU84230.1 MAG: signal recognition particle-docking protein FtsY [Pelagibacterium sp. SCN 63-17]OJX41710.1 MAG: signal recognition particle-docking protein FtsY [Devosia sp. 63-57]VDS03333.1 Signal recognition particle receptor FtsY [Devosia equisanguinis]
MTEKKPGFFQRLFGTQPAPTPAPPKTRPETPVEPAPQSPPTPAPEPVPEPAPVTLPEPKPADHPMPPGPPETTPDYIEAIEDQFVAPPPAVPEPAQPRQGWFARLASGLKRSSDNLSTSITSVFTKRKLDAATLDELEDVLIQADLGIDTAMAITETLRRDRFDKDVSGEDVRNVLATEVEKVLGPVARPLVIDTTKKPFIILMIGVNGSGKTTTIGKLAQKFAREGRSVMLAAGDTFRAAAIEQLQVWGQRTGAPVIARPAGADASGLAFDAVTQAKAEGRDVLIIDTAGRLQNRDELMNELEKVIRVIKKVDPEAPHATLLTLDATTGQNAMKQVEIFGKRAGVTGLVMTKLDGTARGGILVAIAKTFGLPVHFIGVGEGVEDLEPFEASDFARAIAGFDPSR